MTNDPTRVRVSGPLAEHAVGFGEELTRRGYPPERAARHVQLLAGLSRWLQADGLTADDLTAERVAEFLEARRAEGYAEVPTAGWVITLLGYLPAVHVAPMAPAADTVVEAVVEEYRCWLIHQRGLAAPTVRGYAGEAGSFLSHPDRPEGLDLSGLTAREVTAYVVGECRRRRVGSAKVLVTALRSLLRFMSVEGYTLCPLAGAVPAASGMGGGFLPRGMTPEVVAALLGSCDPSTAVGRRDLAILTVLSRLGLRAGEVAGLELEDVDWHHGELVVCGKGARRDRLARDAGLRPRSQRCRPRLHDVRHTFASTSLLGWYRAGVDVEAHLPLLSTYMGHANPSHTFWYLSAVPELLSLAAQRRDRTARRSA
jgi:integrase/recombinase XerD